MKKKVLFIVPLPPPIHGSSMVCQQIQQSEKINAAFDCRYVNLSTSRRIQEIGKFSLISITSKFVRFISSFLYTLWLLVIFRPHICYLAITCHGKGFLKDSPFVLLCKLFKRRIIIHQHNKGMASCVHCAFYRSLLRLVYNKTKVILLSWNLYDDISSVVSKDQVAICPNGIDVSLERRNARNSVPQILFLSNLIESKGVFVLIDACRVLRDKGFEFKCVFVGNQSKNLSYAQFDDYVRKCGVADCVFRKGPLYSEDKRKIFSESDIFVFPTYYENETFGLVLLEAMANSLPVVTCAEGAISDIVSDTLTGYIVPQKDSATLAVAIQKLLDNPEKARIMGQAGRIRYEEMFTAARFEANLISILSE